MSAGRDHDEADLGRMAGVTDRGVRHERNEDAMAFATADGGGLAIAIVCDGVSSAPRPDEASSTASQIAVRVLEDSAAGDPEAASEAAVLAAAAALNEMADPEGAPSATYISAIVAQDAITLCWVGDSRGYWLAAGDASSRRLTTDDSLAGEMVEAGLMTESAAMASPHAHVITRWLGADLAEPRPHVARFEPEGTGAVLICSDGLWNYLPDPEALAGLVLPALEDGGPIAACQALVTFAVEAGGADNITAALVQVPFT